ncbi:BCCT family transporter [Vibrio owensii]|uniref:BCCT family transporter n=1 Tax=Vibrio owensii TaxID=696485 RepID=UPI0009960A37|nr:BCCT family transporter [Vibrio owensii]AQW58729.1 carnitine transporter CniT [Vibrio owensii]MDA0380765.1 BCCT family transporter [Vibrio owensii]
MSNQPSQHKKGAIDKAVFWPATILTLAMAVFFLMNPTSSALVMGKLHAFTTGELGWFFLLATFAVVIFCIYLAVSRYGGVVMGDKEHGPEFSTMTWLGMIFTSGTGGSVLYLGAVEWIWIMQAPPFGVEAGSIDAARWASAYGMFHWGPSAWAWYIACAIPIAYCFYVRKKPTLKMSEFARPVLGKKVDGISGHLINFLYMFGMVGGVMTSLALGTPLISNAIVYVMGWESSNAFLDTFVIFLWTFIPLVALIMGLKKGVSALSDWNVKADVVMLIALLVCGPTAYILNLSVDGLGLMLQNFVYMSLATDVIRDGGFPQAWTIFYFSWWVVYALPFGLFIAKISKGRTIREIVMGGLIAGSLGCMVFYMILPGMGINMQMTGQVDLMSIMNEQGRGAVVYAMLEQMPLGTLFVFAFGLITLISYITGHCAVGYSLAAATQDEIAENEDPAHWNIAFWLILAGVVSLALYFINPESLKPLQTVSILTGFPLCFVIAIVAKSFIKQINIDFPEGFPAADSKGRIYLETPVDRVEEEQVTKPATEPTTSFS